MKLTKLSSRGQTASLGNIVPIVVTLAVAVLVTSLITGVLADVQTDQNDGLNESDFNISGQGLASMLNLSGQFANIGTVIAIVIIVGLLVGAFAAFRR